MWELQLELTEEPPDTKVYSLGDSVYMKSPDWASPWTQKAN